MRRGRLYWWGVRVYGKRKERDALQTFRVVGKGIEERLRLQYRVG
jgi:hypothetical protein